MTDAIPSGLRDAISALPPGHRAEQADGKQGFALVKESSQTERWVLHCSHHHIETKNWGKTAKERRLQKWKTTQVKGLVAP